MSSTTALFHDLWSDRMSVARPIETYDRDGALSPEEQPRCSEVLHVARMSLRQALIRLHAVPSQLAVAPRGISQIVSFGGGRSLVLSGRRGIGHVRPAEIGMQSVNSESRPAVDAHRRYLLSSIPKRQSFCRDCQFHRATTLRLRCALTVAAVLRRTRRTRSISICTQRHPAQRFRSTSKNFRAQAGKDWPANSLLTRSRTIGRSNVTERIADRPTGVSPGPATTGFIHRLHWVSVTFSACRAACSGYPAKFGGDCLIMTLDTCRLRGWILVDARCNRGLPHQSN